MKNIRKMTEDELRHTMWEAKELYDACLEELGRWETVRCVICQVENMAYRDTPWIGWTTSSGFVLCNICTSKYERKYNKVLSGTPTNDPVGELMALLD
jgi:hypothetical protein